jgi:hypothetical protein
VIVMFDFAAMDPSNHAGLVVLYFLRSTGGG